MFKAIINEKFFKLIFIALVLFFFLYFKNEWVNTSLKRSFATQMRMVVIETLGGPCIPIIAQCCTSRNIFEGIYARRSDIPGGFCFHSDCDIVDIRKLYSEKSYIIKKKINIKDHEPH